MVKGKVVMKGYYDMPEETQKYLVEGWLDTGDIDIKNEEGMLYITDRKERYYHQGRIQFSPSGI